MKYGTSALALLIGFTLSVPGAHAEAPDARLQAGVDAHAASSADEDDTATHADTGINASAAADLTESSEDPEVESGDDEGAFSASLHQKDVVKTDPQDEILRVTDAAEVGSNRSLKAYATSLMRADARLDSVEIADKKMDVRYRQPARLLGFIPASLVLTVQVDEQGAIKIDYPWYAFLMKTDRNEKDLETVLASELNVLESSDGGVTNASTSLTASAGMGSVSSVGISNRTRALILDRIHTMLSADANASY